MGSSASCNNHPDGHGEVYKVKPRGTLIPPNYKSQAHNRTASTAIGGGRAVVDPSSTGTSQLSPVEEIKPINAAGRKQSLFKKAASLRNLLKLEDDERKPQRNLEDSHELVLPGLIVPHSPSSASPQPAQSWFEQQFARYVPFMIRHRFQDDPAPLNQPEVDNFPAVVAFVDLSGFTSMSEKLLQAHGTVNSAELLNKYISAYFKQIIDMIVWYGGDIIKFAGDAMLVVWRSPQQSAKSTSKNHNQGNAGGNPHIKHRKSGGYGSILKKRAQEPLQHGENSGDEAAAAEININTTKTRTPPSRELYNKVSSSPRSRNYSLNPTATIVEEYSSTTKGRESNNNNINSNNLNNNGTEAQEKTKLTNLTLTATACCLALLENCNNMLVAGHTLTLHIGIAGGPLKSLYVGGVAGQLGPEWEFFVCGPPIEGVSEACEQANPGELVLHSSVFPLIKDLSNSKRTKHSNSENFILISLLDSPKFHKFVPPSISSAQEKAISGFVPSIVRARTEAGAAAAQNSVWLSEFRRSFIMFIALPDFDYSAAEMLSRLQRCVCAVQESVFKFEGTVARLLCDDKGTRFKIAFGMPSQSHEDDAVRVVMCALEVEKALNVLNQRVAIGIAAGNVYCGLAGSETRCEYTAVGFKVIMAARLMQAANNSGKEQSFSSFILVDEDTSSSARHSVLFETKNPIKLKGVQQPVAIFRPLGGVEKQQIKASKLLGLENNANQPLAHSPKHSGGQDSPRKSQFNINSGQNSLQLPGRQRNMSTIMTKSQLNVLNQPDSIVGREKEKEIVLEALEKVRNSGQTQIIYIECDGGLGKSIFVQHCIGLIKDKFKFAHYFGCGSAIEKRTPYFIWRQIYEQCLGLQSANNSQRRTEVIERSLNADLIQWACLLNPILSTSFPESEITKNLSTESRAKNLQRLLVAILGENHNTETRIIVLEDLHAIDSGSWELCVDICKLLPNLLIILTTRPLNKIVHLAKLLRLNNVKSLPLAELNKAQTTKLVCQKLNAQSIPAQLQQEIFAQTNGMPLFVEELVKSMVEQRLISIEGAGRTISYNYHESAVNSSGIIMAGLASVKGKAVASAGENNVSQTLQNVLIGRIDRLASELQITLKVCSVLGAEIKLKVLKAIYPNNIEKATLKLHLQQLVSAGILQQDSNKGSEEGSPQPSNAFSNDHLSRVSTNLPQNNLNSQESYSFKHTYFIQAAYSMLSLQQRIDLHEKVALVYEAQHSVGSQSSAASQRVLNTLAFHYSCTDKHQKTVFYTATAGKLALSVNANHEAVKMFETVAQLLENYTAQQIENYEKELVNNYSNLGAAYYNQGKFAKAIENLKKALTIALGAENINFGRSASSISTYVHWVYFKDWLTGRKFTKNSREMHKENHRDLEGSTGELTPPRQALQLLEKLVRAALLVGEVRMAIFAAFKMNSLALELGEISSIAIAAAQCAITALEFGYSKIAALYIARLRAIFEDSQTTINDIERASIQQQSAQLFAYKGNWAAAHESLNFARTIYYSGSNYRETIMLQAFIWFLTCKSNLAFRGFSALLASSIRDGDLYCEYHSNFFLAAYYFSTLGPSVRGANNKTADFLACCLEIAEDFNYSDKQNFPALILRQLNDFYTDRNAQNVLNFAEKYTKLLGEPPNLIFHSLCYLHYINLLVEAADFLKKNVEKSMGNKVDLFQKSGVAADMREVQTFHKILGFLQQSLVKFERYTHTFPYCRAYLLLYKAKLAALLHKPTEIFHNLVACIPLCKSYKLYLLSCEAHYDFGLFWIKFKHNKKEVGTAHMAECLTIMTKLHIKYGNLAGFEELHTYDEEAAGFTKANNNNIKIVAQANDSGYSSIEQEMDEEDKAAVGGDSGLRGGNSTADDLDEKHLGWPQRNISLYTHNLGNTIYSLNSPLSKQSGENKNDEMDDYLVATQQIERGPSFSQDKKVSKGASPATLNQSFVRMPTSHLDSKEPLVPLNTAILRPQLGLNSTLSSSSTSNHININVATAVTPNSRKSAAAAKNNHSPASKGENSEAKKAAVVAQKEAFRMKRRQRRSMDFRGADDAPYLCIDGEEMDRIDESNNSD
jgi:class 3 adenylate cyclase